MSATSTPPAGCRDAVREAVRTPCRVVASIGCLVIALVHAVELAPHGARAAYLGVLFGVVAAASLVVGLALWLHVSELWLGGAALLGALTSTALVTTRLVALPGLPGHLGWSVTATVALLAGTITVLASINCWHRSLNAVVR